MDKGERFNFISHLIGSIAACIGLLALLVTAGRKGELLPIVSVAVYGLSLILLYTCSALNHGLQGRAKSIFQRLDFLAIYILIAGTYTPFALIALKESWGLALLSLVWSLAFLGIYLEFQSCKKNRIRSLFIYLTMGWAILLAVKPLIEAIGWVGFSWLLAGGLFYTLGVIFYAFDSRVKYFHGVWHLCVLAGSASQYFAVYRFVL
jgi:hemolysin III